MVYLVKGKETDMANNQEKNVGRGSVQYINPDGLPRNPAFTQAVAVTGPVKTVYVGAQLPVDPAGKLVGIGDIAAQTGQILKNIQTCLEAAGARPEHIITWNIYVVQGQPIQPGFEAAMRWWAGRPNPPANTVLFVAGFPLLPDVLLSIDAIAVVPLET
jgi:enamine deaminase RidA (YjgF/YER057c/UK114 family)